MTGVKETSQEDGLALAKRPPGEKGGAASLKENVCQVSWAWVCQVRASIVSVPGELLMMCMPGEVGTMGGFFHTVLVS